VVEHETEEKYLLSKEKNSWRARVVKSVINSKTGLYDELSIEVFSSIDCGADRKGIKFACLEEAQLFGAMLERAIAKAKELEER